MNQIEPIILYCLKQLHNERTVYSIFHLLNGKKSSQTIQDAHLFSLKNFFGIYESLTREEFDEIIHSIEEKRLISHHGNERCTLTPIGETFLENNPTPAFINGWDYQSFTMVFWERLSLLVQVASNLVYGDAKYLPIQKNKEVHQWVKTVLKEINVPKKELGSVVYTELTDCFDSEIGLDPSILVFRLTGYKQIGLTPEQTAKRLNIDIHDYQICFIHILHYLIHKIRQNPNLFRIFSFLIRDFQQKDELTISSRKTWNFLKQGYTLENIAKLRDLKVSTIEDHIVEFALHIDDFSIDSYVNKDLQDKIIAISSQSATKQLKLIREKLKTVTYFQIRLVLAKYGDR
jgi:uncharacterized protein YpbB